MKPLVLILRDIEKVIEQGKKVSLGRDTENDIVLNNPSVSRKHATIDYRDGQIYVIDHKSKNGTYFNGIDIKNSQQIFPPGTLILGPIRIELQYQDMIAESRRRKAHETS